MFQAPWLSTITLVLSAYSSHIIIYVFTYQCMFFIALGSQIAVTPFFNCIDRKNIRDYAIAPARSDSLNVAIDMRMSSTLLYLR